MQRGKQSKVFVVIGVLLLPLLFLAGCAVLTIDVDVYKGALSNQKDVQTKQLAAMTMAAKPILEGLSNQLRISITNTPSYDGFRVTNLSQAWVNQTLLLSNVVDILTLYEDTSNLQYRINGPKIASIDRSYQDLADAITNLDEMKDEGSLSNAQDKIKNFVNTIKTDAPEATSALNEQLNTLSNFQSNLQKGPPRAQIKEITNTAWTVTSVSRASLAGSLQGGRPDDGIETIITRYLTNSMSLLEPDTNTLLFQKQLLTTTVDFGEKVKFIADNQNGNPYSKYSKYIQTLEAIGNSILSLADALNERLEFERKDAIARGKGSPLKNVTSNLTNAPGITNLIRLSEDTSLTNFLKRQDSIIEGLQDIQVLATLNGQTNIANHARAAHDLVTAYRSDHIYIMPTMTYLRSSYPATSLQNNNDGLWRNMLARESWHSLPLVGEFFSNGSPDDQKNAKIQANIDNQFWQTINQVRVAGSGITSYVITKDDIGNWYVKSYLSDPSPIIEGAKSLALYSIAPAASVGKNLPAVTKTPSTNAEPGLLGTELNILTSNYAAKTFDDGTNILLTTNLVADLKTQLGNIPPPAFTNVFTNLSTLVMTNQTALSVSTNFPVAFTNFSYVITNDSPGKAVLGLLTNAFATSVAGPTLGGSSTNFSAVFTNGIIAGAGTIFTSTGTNQLVAISNAVVLPLPATNVVMTCSNSFEISTNIAIAPVTNTEVRNVFAQFTNSYLSFFTNTSPSVVTNLIVIPNIVAQANSTNLVPVTFFDVATNYFTQVSILTNNVVEIITNKYSFSIVYPTPGSFTNIFTWTQTNTSLISFPPSGTNIVLLTITDIFNNTNGSSTMPVAGVDLNFLQTNYDRIVRASATNLAFSLSTTNAMANVLAIAANEMQVLQQWDMLVNKTALSGTQDQIKLVQKYVAPPLRALANRRMNNLKEYESGLKLLGQSQQ